MAVTYPTPDFSYNISRFDPSAAFTMVRYGANSGLIDTDINEFQQILNNKMESAIKSALGNGISSDVVQTYTSGTYKISTQTPPGTIIVAGKLVYLSSLSISAPSGSTIYLDMWNKEVGPSDTLKLYGNQQETATVTNQIADPRISGETPVITNRIVQAYSLSLATGVTGHTYIELAKITSSGELQTTIKVRADLSEISQMKSDITTLKASVTSLTSGLSTTNTNVSNLSSGLSTTNTNVSNLSSSVSTMQSSMTTKADLENGELKASQTPKSVKRNITINASSWEAVTGQQYIAKFLLSNSNVTATNNIELLAGSSITKTQLAALQSANIVGGAQSAGSIYLLAYGTKPSVDIPVTVMFRKD